MRVQMPATKVHYVALSGGLDSVHSPIVMKDGRMIACENFEEVFGVQGYKRIAGYERFDGRPQPHLAQYYTLNFTAGTAEIAIGDTVTGVTSNASGKVINTALSGGSWAGGDAAGYLIIYSVTGTFVDAENLQVSAATKAVANDTQIIGTIGDSYYASSKLLAITASRAAITAVPGSGSILGAALYRGEAYAARNAADGLTAALYKSSSTGWTLVKDGLIPNGAWRMEVSNFTGAALSLGLFGVDGKNNPWYYNGTAFQQIKGIWNSNASSVTSAAISTGDKTFVLTEVNRNYAVGDAVTVRDSATAANWMAGVVKTWTAGTKTLVVTVATIGGSGTKTAWDIGKTDFSDQPYLVQAHKNHLFWAYPSGQLQTSNLGDPLIVTTTAALFGMGDEITNLLTLKSDNLAIYCRNSMHILSGSEQTSWQVDRYSANGGALLGTAAEIAGVAFHVDDGGIKSLQATQTYGNYETSTLSREVSAALQALLSNLLDCIGHKKNQQYRAYARNGTVLVGTVTTPNAVIAPGDVSFSISKYVHTITCAVTGELTDGSEVHFFGTSDGYLMREGVGASFDGAAISSVLRLPFNNFKLPSNKKRFRKLVLELTAPSTITVNFKQAFDYADGNYPSSENQTALTYGSGGAWGDSAWDTFNWSQPMQTQSEVNIAGIGRNMSLLLWHESAADDAFTLQGILIQYSILGMVR